MNATTIKAVKLTLSVIGLGVNLATTFLSEKELDAKIAKAVSKAITHHK